MFRVRGNRQGKAAAIALLLACASAGHAQAGSTPITLGSASSYGILTGAGNTLTLAGGVNVAGNLGVGQNDTVNLSGNNAVSGNAYEDSGVSINYTGNTSISGSIISQSMASVISAAASAASSAAALTATAGLTDQGGSINIASGQSVTINALTSMSENVLDISALSLTNGTLTFNDNGYTGAKFIVNVTGNFSISSSGSLKALIQGINGASASDVIFNIENTGSTVSITGNSTNQIIGTILAPQRSVTVGGGGTLTGEIIAGVNNAGKSYTVQSTSGGFDINSYAYVPRSTSGGRVPEPSSLALFGVGAAALAALARRYRPRVTRS